VVDDTTLQMVSDWHLMTMRYRPDIFLLVGVLPPKSHMPYTIVLDCSRPNGNVDKAFPLTYQRLSSMENIFGIDKAWRFINPVGRLLLYPEKVGPGKNERYLGVHSVLLVHRQNLLENLLLVECMKLLV